MMASSSPVSARSASFVASGWPVGPPKVRWGLGAALGCFLAAQLLSFLWVDVVVDFRWGGVVPDSLPLVDLPLVNAGLWVGYLGGAAIVSARLGQGFGRDFDLRASPSEYALGVVAGVGTQLLAIPALYWVIGDLLGDPGELAEDLVGQVDGPLPLIALVFSVVVMAPLAEEVMYRGLLLSAFTRRFGPLAGALSSAGIFTIVHPDPATYPGLFLFAIVLALLVARTGRLGVALTAHVAFNLSTVVLLLV